MFFNILPVLISSGVVSVIAEHLVVMPAGYMLLSAEEASGYLVLKEMSKVGFDSRAQYTECLQQIQNKNLKDG